MWIELVVEVGICLFLEGNNERRAEGNNERIAEDDAGVAGPPASTAGRIATGTLRRGRYGLCLGGTDSSCVRHSISGSWNQGNLTLMATSGRWSFRVSRRAPYIAAKDKKFSLVVCWVDPA